MNTLRAFVTEGRGGLKPLDHQCIPSRPTLWSTKRRRQPSPNGLNLFIVNFTTRITVRLPSRWLGRSIPARQPSLLSGFLIDSLNSPSRSSLYPHLFNYSVRVIGPNWSLTRIRVFSDLVYVRWVNKTQLSPTHMFLHCLEILLVFEYLLTFTGYL